jgi:hypothetical protein
MAMISRRLALAVQNADRSSRNAVSFSSRAQRKEKQ